MKMEMKMRRFALLFIFLLSITYSFGGDYLTNTNQSIRYLRNPARGGTIGIDGVYYNPAGLSFLDNGWHFQFNWQQPKQERTIKSSLGPLYAYNYLDPGTQESDGIYSKYFKGKVNIPIQPSIYLAYIQDGWAFQFGAGILGGGGTCKFYDRGVPSFEDLLGSSAISRGYQYSLKSKIEGESYYYGITLGVSKKVTEKLSISFGIRTIFASNIYKGSVDQITFRDNAGNIFNSSDQYVLHAKLDGVGFAPVIGVDYQPNRYLNLSAKYEFRTALHLKTSAKGNNETFNALAQTQPAFTKFLDGEKSRGDMPGLFSCGVQISPIEKVRILGEFKHFFDKDAAQWSSEIVGNTNELLCGVEWDITPKIEVSAGYQRTIYSQKEGNYSDLSFNLNGNSIGFGIGYKLSDCVTLNTGYFRTDYNRHKLDQPMGTLTSSKTFIRKSRVFGLGVDVKF